MQRLSIGIRECNGPAVHVVCHDQICEISKQLHAAREAFLPGLGADSRPRKSA